MRAELLGIYLSAALADGRKRIGVVGWMYSTGMRRLDLDTAIMPASSLIVVVENCPSNVCGRFACLLRSAAVTHSRIGD